MTLIHDAVDSFCSEDIIEAIPVIALLDEFERGHNTFSILLLTPDGRVVYANTIAVNGFQGQTVQSVRGKWLHEFVPEPWLEERLQVFRHAVTADKPIIFIEIIAGVRLCSRIKSIRANINGTCTPVILYTIEPIINNDLDWLRTQTSGYEVITADCIDLGHLNILSDRELEVLALMGKGLRQKDIAKELCRSVSTVNRHRESIGIKLGITDRAQIIRLANIANLEVEDASRNRMPLNPETVRYEQGAEEGTANLAPTDVPKEF